MKKKRLSGLLLGFILMLLGMCMTAWADTKVNTYYVDEHGKSHNVSNVEVLTESSTTWGTEGSTTWYVVNRDLDIRGVNGEISVNRNVNLILYDDATLTLSGSLHLYTTNFTIYGQKECTGNLVASGGIQGMNGNSSSITINGGNIISEGQYGCLSAESGIVINGGKVTVDTMLTLGISTVGSLTINGGTVNVKANDRDSVQSLNSGIYAKTSLTVNGGTVNAEGSEYGIRTNGFRIKKGTVKASGSVNGIKASGFFAITGGSLIAAGAGDNAIDSSYMIISDDMTAKAGNNETDAVIVSDYEDNHPQKWAKIGKAVTNKVTFKTINGSWNNGLNSDIAVELKGFEDETLKLSGTDIPTVGNKPNPGYKVGSWDTTPAANMKITGDTVFTYTYAKKEEAPQPLTEESQPQTEVSSPAAVEKPITIPKAPAKVKTKAKKNTVTVSWNKIRKTKKTKALRQQIMNVEVQFSTDPAFPKETTDSRIIGKNKTKHVLRGLQRKTVYYVRVRYVGADGVSNWKTKRIRTK